MRYRKLGRTGLEVSELGFGAWAIGGHSWGVQDEQASRTALRKAFELGVNFVDTALVYGYGNSERIIGDVIKQAGLRDRVVVATKIPPMNLHWPAQREVPLDEVFPPHHIRQAVNESLRNLRAERLELVQLHVWQDHYTDDGSWLDALRALRDGGKIRFIGVSLNSFEPESALRLAQSGKVDVLQVHYNVFEQRPADALFQAAADAGVGVIVRAPLEESALAGKLTATTRFAEGDFRAVYFAGSRLAEVVGRVEAVRPVLERAAGSMVAGALRFCLSSPFVSTVIPGIRTPEQAEQNLGVSELGPLPPDALAALAAHRWDRNPAEW